jgi:hypothetical protein
MNGPNTVHTLYKRLLKLYPQEFREQFAESMQQTFSDRYHEQGRIWFGFVSWMFIETAMGIVREHALIHGTAMKNSISNPKRVALISFLLCLPLGLIFLILMLDIEFLAIPLHDLLTVNGRGSEINTLGRIVILGGLLLLPVAFILNLQPLLVREGPDGKRTLHKVNLILAAAILLLIAFTWGALLMEQIYCLQGIRCD